MNRLPSIHISENQRFLVTDSGAPFFWLGDTAWELFHRLERSEAEHFFATRARQRFTVIQAVVLAEFEGLTVPNAYGDLPLIDLDPTRPNEAYFQLVDEYIDLAAAQGLYIGLLPTWGDKVTPMWGVGPQVFTAENAYIFGRFLAQRYQNRSNLLWILGGDRPAVHEQNDFRPIWQRMAAGIDAGNGRHDFKTYHPNGGKSTSLWLHEERWLDMHMMQSGHGSGRDTPVWEMIRQDYNLASSKPTLDGEPNYEDHPVNPWPTWQPANGYYRDHDVRKQIYRSVFAGGCGVTYGHHAVWQFFDPAKRKAINHADRPWQEAIERSGANQVKHLRALIESRPYLTRIPDQSLILSQNEVRDEYLCATGDSEGRYTMVYFPTQHSAIIDLRQMTGEKLTTWWFNPRTGASQPAAPAQREPTFFLPPIDGPDWVLVVDDAAAGFGAPGRG